MDSSIEESKTNKNMKKNIVKINESSLRKIVAESVKKILREEYVGDENFEGEGYQEEPVYGIGTVVYDINSNSVRDYDDDGDDFESVAEAIKTIEYMCTYPKGSAEWDIRYANDWVPAFYVYDKNLMNRIDNKLYLSSTDAKYEQYFKSNGADEIVIVNAKNINENTIRKIVAESIKRVLKENGPSGEREGFYEVELDFDAYKHAIGPEAPSDDEYLAYWMEEHELPDKVCVRFRIYVTEDNGDMDTPPYSSAELKDWRIDDDQLDRFGNSLRIIIERAVEYRMEDVDPDVLINYVFN